MPACRLRPGVRQRARRPACFAWRALDARSGSGGRPARGPDHLRDPRGRRPSCRRPRCSSPASSRTRAWPAPRWRLADNQTTGGFLGHDYTLTELIVPADGDLVAAFKEALAAGERLFVADLLADDLLAIADLPEAAGALIFNGRAQDDALRTERLPGERVPHLPEPGDEGRRAGAVPGLEALDPLVPDPRRAAGGPGVRRRRSAVGRQVRRARSSRSASTRTPATSRAHRHRPRAGPAPDAGLHPGRARPRRAARRRRERRVRRVPALPAPGTRGRSPAPRAWCRPPGAACTSSGAAPRCSAASRSTRGRWMTRARLHRLARRARASARR